MRYWVLQETVLGRVALVLGVLALALGLAWAATR